MKMNKDLEAKIEERKKDAMDRNIAFKADAIAKHKGKTEHGVYVGDKAFEDIVFQDLISNTFRIESYTRWPVDIRDGGYEEHNIFIYYLRGGLPGREVFREVNGEIYIYRPNHSWENQLDELYLRVLKEGKDEKKVEMKQEEAIEADLRNRFEL